MNRFITPALVTLGLIIATFCIYSMVHTAKSVQLMNEHIAAVEASTNQTQQTA